MTPHDDLEQVLARALRQLLHSHVIDDQQIWLEIVLQDPLVTFHRLVVQEVADRDEDRPVVHCEGGVLA